jgi:hypothetical protein
LVIFAPETLSVNAEPSSILLAAGVIVYVGGIGVTTVGHKPSARRSFILRKEKISFKRLICFTLFNYWFYTLPVFVDGNARPVPQMIRTAP